MDHSSGIQTKIEYQMKLTWKLFTDKTLYGQNRSYQPGPCESQPHKGHLTSKPDYRRFPSYLLWTPLIYFWSFIFPGASYRIFLFVSSLDSLPFLPCFQRVNNNRVNKWTKLDEVRLWCWSFALPNLAQMCGLCEFFFSTHLVISYTIFQ